MPESAALAQFRLSLQLARELITLEVGYADPPALIDEQKVRGLRGGAAVLMVAAFEAYLRSGIAEMLRPLVGPPPKQFGALPEKLQVASIYESLDHALRGPRYGQPGKKIDRLPAIFAAAARVALGQIDPDALSQTGGNPDSETVERILKNVGLKKPFEHIRQTFDANWQNPEAANFIADKLDEIVQRRHKVAHTADALAISRVDLSSGLKFLTVLAETIDASVQAHVAAL